MSTAATWREGERVDPHPLVRAGGRRGGVRRELIRLARAAQGRLMATTARQ